MPREDNQAFHFLDLSLVVQGCHLILSFCEGQTNELPSAMLMAAWLLGDVLDKSKTELSGMDSCK